MLNGIIVNINSNRFKVLANDKEYICSARGKFRNDKIIPLVGDNVLFNENTLQIEKILERKNFLLRPMIANVDIAVVITSTKEPDLDLNLLDKLLTVIHKNKIKPLICFTKTDLLNEEEKKNYLNIRKYYEKYYDVVDNTETTKFKEIIQNKVVVLCGQTGAGKSTFINKIDDKLNLETNEISKALGRGKHTTRTVSLVEINNGKVLDTPGFSDIDLSIYKKEDIRDSFKEFKNKCKYTNCMHINEKECVVKELVNKNIILKSRYENYIKFIK